jgi:hypothetical protein
MGDDDRPIRHRQDRNVNYARHQHRRLSSAAVAGVASGASVLLRLGIAGAGAVSAARRHSRRCRLLRATNGLDRCHVLGAEDRLVDSLGRRATIIAPARPEQRRPFGLE